MATASARRRYSRHPVVEGLLAPRRGREVLHHAPAVGEADVLLHLPAQRAEDHRGEALPQLLGRPVGDAAVLGVHLVAARKASSGPRICSSRNESSPKSSIRSFCSGVAVRSSLGGPRSASPERLAGLVPGPAGVAQPVRLVDDHQVPGELRGPARRAPAAKGWQAMTGTGWSNGLPGRRARRARRPPPTARPNLSCSSSCHWARSEAGDEHEDPAASPRRPAGRGRCPPRWSCRAPPRRRACSRPGGATRARRPPPPPGAGSGRPGPRSSAEASRSVARPPLSASSSASSR